MKKISVLFFLVLLLSAVACNRSVPGGAKAHPKNIILLIGDGMGLTQVSTSFYFNDQPSNFARFKHIGLQQNMPTSHKVTDSAAAATSIASGVKTYNGAIGVDQDTVATPTILEILAKEGWSTGLIATSSIVHATPAAFYAHVTSRGSYEDIAQQLVHAPVNFFAGGGLQFFAKRSDGLNYVDSLVQNGFEVYTTSMSVASPSIKKKYGFLLAPDGMPKMQEGRGDFLPRATQMALDQLSQDKDGFFLMVEGSQIDWGGHANDAEYTIQETIDFDKAIGVALDFAQKDGHTLVIVTADHETGGLSLSAATVFGRGDYGQIAPSFSTGNHSATLIPVFAYGPGAEHFMGVYQNNEIFDKMLRSVGSKVGTR